MSCDVPGVAKDAVLQPSTTIPDSPKILGYEWNNGINYEQILGSYLTTGFQATNVGLAVEEIRKMLDCRRMQMQKEDTLCDDPFFKLKSNCTLFLGFTSNLVSSGLRETLRFLVQNSLVDCIVTTAGGIEEDLIKVLAPSYLGSFNMDGKKLRQQGINRIGNLLVPNDNYCKFEDWLVPILDKLLEEKNIWTPSELIYKLGLEINNESSLLYWAAKNSIPVFSPALTDGSLGDLLYFHSFRKPGLVIDILGDLRKLNGMAVRALNTGMIILGGGLIKHHICNANLMRNGADFSVYINTGNEFDGSDSGASPDEAVSWGKIKGDAKAVKVFADATLVFPLIVAQTFAKEVFTKASI